MPTAAQVKAAKARKAKLAKEAVDAPDTGLGVPQVVKTNKIQFRSRATGSKYDALIEMAVKLKIGETLKIPVEEGVDIVAIRNRLGAVVRRKVAPQIEGKTRLRVTQDGFIAICVE